MRNTLCPQVLLILACLTTAPQSLSAQCFDMATRSTWDTGNPEQSKPHGKLKTPEVIHHGNQSGSIWDLFVSDNIAYVAAGHAGVHILDVTDTQNPTLAGHIPAPELDGSITDLSRAVTAKDQHLYVGGSSGKVHVYDINDLADIQQIAVLNLLLPIRMLIDQSHLYVNDNRKITIVDISDPANPTLEHTTDFIFDIFQFEVRDQIIYAAAQHFGPLIIDASLPGSPAILSKQPPLDVPYTGLHIKGNHAVMAPFMGVYDISDPSHPILVKEPQEDLPRHFSRAAGQDLLITHGDLNADPDYDGQWYFWDIADPTQPQFLNDILTVEDAPDAMFLNQQTVFTGSLDSGIVEIQEIIRNVPSLDEGYPLWSEPGSVCFCNVTQPNVTHFVDWLNGNQCP